MLAQGCPAPGIKDKELYLCTCLASALADPRFVGVHWFQWIDQSAGRKDRENHQCGFIDVAGKACTELVNVVSKATKKATRNKAKQSTESILN